MRRALVTSVLLLIGLLVAVPAPAQAGRGAGDHRPSWLSCPSKATMRAARGVVLLIAGTGSRPAESFSWGYEPALRSDGFATCTAALPADGLGSFTTAAVRVRRAIRFTSTLAGHRISIVGHSQGGALPVWAVKHWPRTAARVDDVVSLAGPFGGTRLGNELCVLGRCHPLAWQLRQGSRTVAALRSGPIPRGVSVTSLAGPYDEVVRPQPQASQLDGAVNIVLNTICLNDPSEHGLILGDPLGYDLAVDALTHPGPADPERLRPDVCQQAVIKHFDPIGALAFGNTLERFTQGLLDPRGWVEAEPALPPYAR